MNKAEFSINNRIPTFIEGNKLYLSIEPSYVGSKTIYHFKNMDVILPNLFGFDIHNYSDEIIEYDRRRKGTFVICKKMTSIRIYRDEYQHYDAKYYTDNSTIDNTIQITNNSIIFYYLSRDEQCMVRSITIPKTLLFNVECVTINMLYSIDTIMFMIFYRNKFDPLVIELTKSKVTKDINIEDEEILQLLKNDADKLNYSKFLLSSI